MGGDQVQEAVTHSLGLLRTITDRDWECADWAIEHHLHYLAPSFVRRADHITLLRQPLANRGSDIPLIAKDEIKQALMDVLGLPSDIEESHNLGRAAVHAMIAVARSNRGAVLDSVWMPYTIPLVRTLEGPVIEVRCTVSRTTAQARYAARARSRHPGHMSDRRSADELWNTQLLAPLGVGPVVTVDTEQQIDPGQLATRVRTAMRDPDATSAN